MTRFADDALLGAARDWLRARVEHGERCPCCTQFARVYRRRIHTRMAADLIRLHRRHGGEWFHMPTTLGINGGDTAKFQHWGLMQEDEDKRHDGGRAGYWRLTEAGTAFVLRHLTVPTYAHIYDGRCLGLSGERIGIVDALGHRFDYVELMADPPSDAPPF